MPKQPTTHVSITWARETERKRLSGDGSALGPHVAEHRRGLVGTPRASTLALQSLCDMLTINGEHVLSSHSGFPPLPPRKQSRNATH
jgi:hypothetical protein